MIWRDDVERPFSTLIENGKSIATIERISGEWRYTLAQSVVAHRSPTSRTTSAGSYADKDAAKIAAEDHIDRARAIAPDPPHDPSHALRTFDILKHEGIWR